MNIYYVGRGIGTDAGGWFIGPDGKVHHVPGWEPDAMSELARALTVIGVAAQFKVPGLAQEATHAALGFAQKELAQHIKGGGVLVLR